jgi:hypothetical protein
MLECRTYFKRRTTQETVSKMQKSVARKQANINPEGAQPLQGSDIVGYFSPPVLPEVI